MQRDSSFSKSITIAVVIPAYNAEKYLLQTLESVWGQTRPPDEIIVVNDGSTDRTFELLEKVGHRLRVLHTPNRGLAAARNAGVSLAQSHYVAFLDADDYWPANKLTIYESLAQQHAEVGLFYSDSVCVQEGGVYRYVRAGAPGPHPFFRLLKFNFIASSSVMIDKEMFLQVGGLRGGFAHPAGVVDWDFFLNAVHVKPFHYIPESLMFYRVHATSAMQTRQKAMWRDSLRVVLWHSRKRNVPSTVKKEALSSLFYHSGLRLLVAGHPRQARNHFVRSVQCSLFSFSSVMLFFISFAGPRAISVLSNLRRHLYRFFLFMSKPLEPSERVI